MSEFERAWYHTCRHGNRYIFFREGCLLCLQENKDIELIKKVRFGDPKFYEDRGINTTKSAFIILNKIKGE